jgi:glycosyltransferase involved in cell wall biosynthesis
VKRNSLSIVLPVHNAAGRLPALVAEALALAARHADDYELILALDGADGATESQAISLAATHVPVALLRSPRRRGFRAALQSAWGVARGDAILCLDHQQVAVAQAAKLLAARDDHAVVLGYRLSGPGDPRPGLAAILDRGRAAREPRDPTLRLALVRAELRELIDLDSPDQLLARELFSGAQHRGLPLAQVAVAGKAPDGAGAEQRRGAAVGLGMLVVAGALWMLRRWLPNGK